MKNLDKRRNEKGAIMVMTAIMMTVLIGFTALSIDIGLHYYLGAKLQNAVDSSATAVASELGSTNSSLEDTAYDYLAENGFDRNGKYENKITVTVTPKAVVDEASVGDDYITSGYYKVTASVQDSSVLGKVLGIESYNLVKTAYVKCEADYTTMPDALNYTVFGASTKDSDLGTVRLAGRTSATTNEMVNWMENLVNGVNSKIVQPVAGWLGLSQDYSGVQFNTSEIITNGDVHSNSNILIGVQALNASRVKDVDYEGNTDEYEDENNNEYIDYGQVTYTAATTIGFNYSGQESKSHIYVQNQQYLEDTQIVLNVINQLDFSAITSTESLKNHYLNEVVDYVKGLGSAYYAKSNGTYTDKGSNLLDRLNAQAEKLRYDSSTGKYYLDNQYMIVYNISQSTAKSMLSDTASTGLSALNNSIIGSGGTGSDPIYSDETNSVFYYPGKTTNPPIDIESSQDSDGNSLSYDIQFTKTNSDDTASLTVTGTQLNRSYINLLKYNSGDIIPATTNGAQFALARTFIENSDYIATPNMKPYFVRQIKTSFANATTTSKNESGSTSIKGVVEDTSEELQDYVDSTDYTDDEYATLDDDGNVKTFDKTKSAHAMFSSIKESSDSGLTDLTSGSYTYQTSDWTLIDSKHSDSENTYSTWTVSNTKFKNYSLYNSTGVLKTPTEFVNEFASKYITPDSTTGESTYGAGAIKKYYDENVAVDNDYDDYTVTDYENHYGNEAVQKKKNYLKNNVSYDSIANNFGSFREEAPSSSDVFLKSSGTIHEAFDNAFDYIKSNVEDDPISSGSSSTVDKPTTVQPDFTYYPSVPSAPSVSNKTFTLGKVTYTDSDFITDSDNDGTYNQTVADLIKNYSSTFSWSSNSTLQRVNESGEYTTNLFKNETGEYHKLKSDTYAHNPEGKASYTSGRGFLVEANTAVWYDGGLKTGSTNKNPLYVRSGATLLLGGSQTVSDSYVLYVANSCTIEESSVVAVNGSAYIDSSLTIGNNAIVVINGDLYVKGAISIGEGATLIVTGSMTAYNSTVTLSNNANVYIAGGLTYASSSNKGLLNLGDGSTLVIFNNGGQSTAINFDTKINSGTTLYVKNDVSVWSSLTINDGGVVYAENLSKYSSSDLDITVNSGGTFYSSGTVTANTFTDTSNISYFNNIVLEVSKDDKTQKGKITATHTYIAGDITAKEISCYQIKVLGNCTVTNLNYSGNMFVGSKLTIDSDFTTNGKIHSGNIECNGTLTNDANCLDVSGEIKANSIVNTSILYCGSVNVSGDLTNGSNDNGDAVIYCDSTITVGGNLINYGKIASDAPKSVDYAITVGGRSDVYNNGIVYTSKSSYKTYDLTLNKGCEFSIKGDLVITNILINNTQLYISGDFVADKIENNALIYVSSSIEIEYLKNNQGAGFACKGDLTLTGAVDGKSLYNEGECYINGDISSAGSVYVDKGKLYVYGDLVGANKASDYGIDNALWVENHSYVYINGYINSETADMHIWIQGDTDTGTYTGAPTSTIVSVYGYHIRPSITSVGSNVTVFCNQQKGANVYFGTGTSTDLSSISGTIEFTGSVELDGTDAFENAGNVYIYGKLSLPNSTMLNLYNDGCTYIGGSLTAPNATLSVKDGHEFRCYKDATIAGISADKGYIYLLSKATVTGNTTLKNNSILYVGKNSTVDVANATISASTIYLPEQKTPIYYNTVFSGNCGLVTESDVVFTANTTIPSGTTLYVGGSTTLQNATITNSGNMYLVGSIDATGNSKDAFSFKDGSDSYIGVISETVNSTAINGTLYIRSSFEGYGNIYIENNLQTTGYTKSPTVGNRYTTLYVSTGNTYVSGSVTTADDQGVLINANTSISCKNDFTVGSTIYNYGKFIVTDGSLVTHNGTYCTDRDYNNGKNDMHTGYSLKNGTGEGDTSAEMYIGGTGTINFYGYVRNSGSIYANSAINVQGWGSVDGVDGVCAFVNYAGSQAHFNGYAHMNSNVLYNKWDSTFACNGDLKFGTCIYNCGNVIATGDITNVEGNDTVNTPSYVNGSSKSIINGAYKIDYSDYYKCVYKNAVLYCGGNLQLGTTESAGNAGSFISYGTTYVGGNFDEYTNTSNSFYKTAIWLYNDTNTFVGGNCFGGGGVVTGNNSIFMCGGDFESKRSLKINAECKTMYYVDVGEFTTYTDNDNFTPAYFYVGGNLLANVLGKSVYDRTSTLSTKVPENSSRDLDIYSNANVYVVGSLYANCKVYMKQNVTIVVCGEKLLYSADGKNLVERITTAITPNMLKYIIQDAIDGNKYKFFAYQCLDENVCSKLIVNGSAYVKDTAKIRDMSKTYIYGNFKCADYVELGKALDGKDETEAKETLFRDSGDSDGDSYTSAYYKNAGYMYVGGYYKSSGYTRIYASTTLRVRDDFTTNSTVTGYLELKHDARIYVGKKLKANGTGSNISIKFPNLSASQVEFFGIRGSTYSQFYVGGSMQATMSSINIKDASTCIVGGNMVSYLGHIALGETGDYARSAKDVSQGTEVTTCDCCDDCINQSGCTCGCSKCIYDSTDCQCCDSCTNDEFCECDCGSCNCTDSTTSTGAGSDTTGNAEEITDTTLVDSDTELYANKTDKAVGGTFYVGGVLASYTSYIKEFAFSKVVVGNYVYTPKYLTIRHNADLWVLPEMYDNVTSSKFKYTGCDYCTCASCTCEDPSVTEECNCCKDCTNNNLWSRLKTSIKNYASEISDDFTPKQGSIYSLGELTLNEDASLLGTYDCTILGQTVLRQDSLVYLGHDFTCSAPSVNLTNYIKDGNLLGFESGLLDSESSDTPAPVVVYADNDINISTTINMQLTYLIANYGDVNLYDVYSSSDNDSRNLKELPNAVCSYQGNIDYYAMYGKISALFYAPGSGYRVSRDCNCCTTCSNAYKYDKDTCSCSCSDCKCGEVGVIDLDGYYEEIWGSVIGNRIKANTYYLTLHRFTNWRTMDLHIAEAGNIYLISEEEYNNAVERDDDEYDMFELETDSNGGADLFFDLSEDE